MPYPALVKVSTAGLQARIARRAVMLAMLAIIAFVVATPQNVVGQQTQPGDAARPQPAVGAIRWDAWHGEAGKERHAKAGGPWARNGLVLTPGLAVERSLGPKHWHCRLPFYAKVLADDRVEIRGNSQEVMDREIAYAGSAGLAYWAFLTYHPDDAMSLGLKFYLSSKLKAKINFCVILHHIRVEQAKEEIDRIVGCFKDPQYQKVLGERPLVYMFSCRAGRPFIDGLRAGARAAGLAEPFFVLMDSSKKTADSLGFEALSSYAARGGKAAWESWRRQGAKVVPAVSSGWDRRPRVEHPVPWEGGTPTTCPDRSPRLTRPAEIAKRVKEAIDWIGRYPEAGAVNAVIIYAWNEFDEGGWLCPTLSEGTARLDALATVLKPQPTSQPAQPRAGVFH